MDSTASPSAAPAAPARRRVLSGMRPTGRMHLGNWVGALENWVRLQRDGRYEMFYMIADLHALTTAYEDTAGIVPAMYDMVVDWLAAGLDPAACPIFPQSRIHQHAELHLLLSMLVTVPRLERNPTLKEQARDLGLSEQMTYGFLGYPVLQAADILVYKGDAVPVGEDQVPHVEITREIARRFNNLYGPVFPEPDPLLTATPRLPGLDGAMKMSKSAGNTLLLTEEPEDLKQKLRKAVTDVQKVRKGDPGRPEVCAIYTYQSTFNAAAKDEIAEGCRSGALGCVDCKGRLAAVMTETFDPIRTRRVELLARPDYVREVIDDGVARASVVAERTMNEVWDAVKMPPAPSQQTGAAGQTEVQA